MPRKKTTTDDDEIQTIGPIPKNHFDGDPLFQAVVHKKLDEVKALLKQPGTTPNIQNEPWFNQAPAHVAASNGSIQILEELADHQGSLALTDDFNNTPLHYAVDKLHPKTVSWLVEHHAPLDTPNFKDRTPLTTALHKKTSRVEKQHKIIKTLVEAHAKVEERYKEQVEAIVGKPLTASHEQGKTYYVLLEEERRDQGQTEAPNPLKQ